MPHLAVALSCSAQRFPGLSSQRFGAVRDQEFCELAPLFRSEARTNADLLQCAGIVEEAEQ